MAALNCLIYLPKDGEWKYCCELSDSDWENDKQAEAKKSTYPTPIRIASGGLVGGFESVDYPYFFQKTVVW